jgi:hypothetical protein
MAWLLVVMVLGSVPVSTNLVFGTLDECLQAEDQLRAATREHFDAWLAWARADPAASGFPDSERLMRGRLGLENSGTCVPHGAQG